MRAEPVRLRTLARAIAALAQELDDPTAGAEPFLMRDPDLARLARDIYRERKRRARFFPAERFGEPAWDMLLDLFVASCENKLRSVKEVCISSHVPDATALRHIEHLIDDRLVVRTRDTRDNRRKFLALTRAGQDAMAGYLTSVPEIGESSRDLARYLIEKG